MNNDFEKLQTLYDAIKDLDKVYKSNSKDKLTNLGATIKSINLSLIDVEDQDKIILEYRSSLLKIYTDVFNLINENIETPGGLDDSNQIKSKPIESKNNEEIISAEYENDVENFVANNNDKFTKELEVRDSRYTKGGYNNYGKRN